MHTPAARRRLRLMAALAALPLAGGCVAAAALPVLAGGAVARQQMRHGKQDAPAPRATPTPGVHIPDEIVTEDGRHLKLVQGPLPRPDGAPPSDAAVAVRPVPPGMQFLYGSGEAAALSIQAYQALWNYVQARLTDRAMGREVSSVVLTRDATLEKPSFVPCGTKPLAVVFDIDETVLLNLGYESNEARTGAPYDQGRWDRWERTGAQQVTAVPGAAETIAQLRSSGIIVVFNSNRSKANADATAAALASAGLGPARHGETLWLEGDVGVGGRKDPRRWDIASRYCVIAMAGDQLGDFSDLFNAPDQTPDVRRNRAGQTMVAPMWGTGWFLLPNPVYGTGLKGDLDQVFPKNMQWADPAEEK